MQVANYADGLVNLGQIGLRLEQVEGRFEYFEALRLVDGALTTVVILECLPVRDASLEKQLVVRERPIDKGGALLVGAVAVVIGVWKDLQSFINH
jgi:hypothetical protein